MKMKTLLRSRFVVLVTLLLLSVKTTLAVEPVGAKADDKKTQHKYLRLQRDEQKKPLSLDTAIIRCAPKKGDQRKITVDLVAAIHIADAEYYRRLNREFKGYDAVLYELVAPEEANKPRQGAPAGSHPVSLLQNGMKNLLELQFQLDGVNYKPKYMVHADMSPEQFARSMKENGESLSSLFMRMFSYALAKQNQSDGLDGAQLLVALFDKNRALALKRLLAEQFADGDAFTAIEEIAGKTLIKGRNKVALKVLKKQTGAGKKKIAIFYGAGHMPDLLMRLRKDFSLEPVNTRWLVAWDLKGGENTREAAKDAE